LAQWLEEAEVNKGMNGAGPLLSIDVAAGQIEAAIVLSGELDVSTAPALRNQLHLLIDSGAINLTCHISGLRYIDSSGLSVIVMAQKRLNMLGGNLILLSPVPTVRRFFEISGVDDYLAIQPTEATEATG
jgi:anti-sigma B factor antagonist